MSDPQRDAEFLTRRLRELGLDVRWTEGSPSAIGVLRLGPEPLETLSGRVRIETVRFYTVGHRHLKPFHPRPLFDLPLVDVGLCIRAENVEAALRDAWRSHLRNLEQAREHMALLGVPATGAVNGTRLRLDLSGAGPLPFEARSADEILLSSSGPLANQSLRTPSDRRFRIPSSIGNSTDLGLAVSTAMQNHARACASPPAPIEPDPENGDAKRIRPVALASRDEGLSRRIETDLSLRDVEIHAFRNADDLLAAFHVRSYELAIIDVHSPQIDGFDLVTRLRRIPGVEELPILAIDRRDSDRHREIARTAGAAAYLAQPLRWADLVRTVEDLLDGVHTRRFERYPVRLPVGASATSPLSDGRSEQISRKGMCVRTPHDVQAGERRHYYIGIPGTGTGIDVEAEIVTRILVPGSASVLAGVQFLRFADGCEPRWIELIEALACRKPSGR